MLAVFREIPNKSNYRRYEIKQVSKIDDYAMIQEALRRMLVGIKQGRETFKPDLILIDGGLGHLRAAEATLREMEAPAVKVLSIAKRELVAHCNAAVNTSYSAAAS